MTVYYVLVVLLLLFGMLMHRGQNGNTKYVIVLFVLLFCVHGLRDTYTIGVDSKSSYLHGFQEMEDAEWSDLGGPFDWVKNLGDDSGIRDKNPGIRYLMKIVSDLTDGDYQLFVTLLSAWILLANAHFVRKYSPNPLQSVLYFLGLMFFTFHISALKQSLAMGFIIYSFDAVVERKPIRFLILVMIASVFHYPALVFLPAYWIGNMKMGQNYVILLAILLLIVYLFRDQIMEWMNDAYYGEDSGHTLNTNARFLMNKVIVMLVIIVVALVIRPPHSSDRVYCSLLALIGVATVIQTFAGYGNIFERLADYYFQFAIVFIPMVFENVETKRSYLKPRVLMMVRSYGPYIFCAFAIWRFLTSTSGDVSMTPYHFYFNAPPREEELAAIWRIT